MLKELASFDALHELVVAEKKVVLPVHLAGAGRLEYNKSVAKIDAINTAAPAAGNASNVHPAVIFEEGRRHDDEPEKNFGYWLKVGLAITLPLIITLFALIGAIVWRLR